MVDIVTAATRGLFYSVMHVYKYPLTLTTLLSFNFCRKNLGCVSERCPACPSVCLIDAPSPLWFIIFGLVVPGFRASLQIFLTLIILALSEPHGITIHNITSASSSRVDHRPSLSRLGEQLQLLSISRGYISILIQPNKAIYLWL